MSEEVAAGSKTTTVLKCKCAHAYQDKRYGKSKRLHNIRTTKNPSRVCTVCGDTK